MYLPDGTEVFLERSNSEENKKYELILSATVLSINENDIIHIKLPPSGNKWIFKFHFIHDLKKEGMKAETKVENEIVHIYLNRWYSPYFVENTEPFTIESVDKSFRVYLKLRTTCEEGKKVRSTLFSFWKEK